MKIGVVGASGKIGRSFVEYFSKKTNTQKMFLFSRSNIDITYKNIDIIHKNIDIEDEISIKNASNIEDNLDYLFITTGILSTKNILPEKSINDLCFENFMKLYSVNTIGPALIAKHFMKKMNKNSIFVILSARVGSIKDNYLGGWYSYRCSKASLNMFIKCLSIEMKRKIPNMIIIGMHPGTVYSDLSKDYLSNIKKDKIFTSDYSVMKMMSVIDNLTIQDTGKLFAWDGQEIHF
eukprot:GHVL01031776.1.p1 GENE.GHVL01031776.1~~GHVL01031776.1.p1  ORF type:complete len:235 (+),score=59.73 GHVL01031776.1:36-740(+)